MHLQQKTAGVSGLTDPSKVSQPCLLNICTVGVHHPWKDNLHNNNSKYSQGKKYTGIKNENGDVSNRFKLLS